MQELHRHIKIFLPTDLAAITRKILSLGEKFGGAIARKYATSPVVTAAAMPGPATDCVRPSLFLHRPQPGHLPLWCREELLVTTDISPHMEVVLR